MLTWIRFDRISVQNRSGFLAKGRRFEIQAFEQIGNDKKAQIHVLFRQNLEKRFVVFWLSPEIAVIKVDVVASEDATLLYLKGS